MRPEKLLTDHESASNMYIFKTSNILLIFHISFSSHPYPPIFYRHHTHLEGENAHPFPPFFSHREGVMSSPLSSPRRSASRAPFRCQCLERSGPAHHLDEAFPVPSLRWLDMLAGPKKVLQKKGLSFFWNIPTYNVTKPELDFEESVIFVDGCQSWVRFCIRSMDRIGPNMLARLVRFGLVVYTVSARTYLRSHVGIS